MATEPPDDAAIEHMLASAAEESWRNSGGPETVAHAQMLRARARYMAGLSVRFDMITTVFYVALAVVVGFIFFSVL